jgi:hypothetical protein
VSTVTSAPPALRAHLGLGELGLQLDQRAGERCERERRFEVG